MKIIYKDGHVDECPQDQELHVIRHTAAHIMALDSLRHDVSSGVADNMQFLVLRALVHMAVFVDDLHSGSPFDES